MDNLIRVAFSPTIFDSQKEGGISRYYFQLITGLMNHENIGVYLEERIRDRNYIAQMNGENLHFFNDFDRRAIFPNINFATKHRINGLQKIIPHIVHETFYGSTYFKSAPKSSIKILTVYDLIDEIYSIRSLKFSKKQPSLRLANHVICISETTKQDLVNILKYPENKISVIKLAPFPLNIPSQPEILIKNLNFEEKKYFLYVGVRESYKNFNRTLLAFRNFLKYRNDFKYVVFGGGEFMESELRMINELNLEDYIVRVQGDDQELRNLYKSAFALIYPSIYEGFGMPPLESLSLDTPVIIANTSSSREILGNESAVYFQADNEDDLLRALLELVNNKDLYDKKIVAGRIVSQKYSWHKCVSETANLYRELMN